MSHELLQPLFAAHNYALACDQRIAAEPDCVPHQIAKWLGAMKECLEHAKQLVDHYRHFAGANESAWVTVELDPCIENVLQIAARELGQHHLEIHYRGAEGLQVQGDPLQLQQVLLNLIRNASDALDEAQASSPILRIETFADPAAKQVGIRLQDNGPGLPTIDRDRIFEPYLTTKSSGLGLGLAICRRIVESHGGRIDADSSPDGGAEFTIRLPQVAPKSAPTSPDEACHGRSAHHLRG
jgi:signal transduction histidine kinase